MKKEIQNLDLIDIISERNLMLRYISEKTWNHSSNINISNSEWFIMNRIYKKTMPISYVAKNADISRQAAHKVVKSLHSKGLIEITTLESNRRYKYVQLTPLGEECYEKNSNMKSILEKKIAEKIGADKFNILKDILSTDWGL
ncbi:MAG: MarR family winged helix-turn-helix transcriptional regulator [Solirubrobacterales bacterium]